MGGEGGKFPVSTPSEAVWGALGSMPKPKIGSGRGCIVTGWIRIVVFSHIPPLRLSLLLCLRWHTNPLRDSPTPDLVVNNGGNKKCNSIQMPWTLWKVWGIGLRDAVLAMMGMSDCLTCSACWDCKCLDCMPSCVLLDFWSSGKRAVVEFWISGF